MNGQRRSLLGAERVLMKWRRPLSSSRHRSTGSVGIHPMRAQPAASAPSLETRPSRLKSAGKRSPLPSNGTPPSVTRNADPGGCPGNVNRRIVSPGAAGATGSIGAGTPSMVTFKSSGSTPRASTTSSREGPSAVQPGEFPNACTICDATWASSPAGAMQNLRNANSSCCEASWLRRRWNKA